MTLRRFMILLRGLPYDSAWVGFLNDDEQYKFANYNPQKLKVR